MTSSYHHGNLKEALLQTASRLINNGNRDKLTIRHLAEQCHVSASAAYRHFASKDDIIKTIAAQGFEQFTDFINHRVQHLRNPVDRLHQHGIAYVQFALDNPHLFRLLFSSILTSDKKSKRLKIASQTNYELLIDTIEDGIKQKLLTGESKTLILATWSMVHGLATLLINQATEITAADQQRVISQVTRTLHHGILSPK